MFSFFSKLEETINGEITIKKQWLTTCTNLKEILISSKQHRYLQRYLISSLQLLPLDFLTNVIQFQIQQQQK